MMIPMPRNKPEPLYRDMTRPPPTWTSLSRRNPNRKVEVWEDGLSGQRVTRMREERVSECLHVCRGGWLCHEWSVLMPTVHVSWADHRPARSRRQTQSKWRLCGGTWRHSRRVPLHSASIVLCDFGRKTTGLWPPAKAYRASCGTLGRPWPFLKTVDSVKLTHSAPLRVAAGLADRRMLGGAEG